ncbi:hypothetical protein BLNAU_18572 [Blattamonas nauphoetae]|uniref:Uncharacterized protein n=1 Tax=Blattamonas nauphoetae TaxID=2049346 RepID=A0ABQ9X4B3_9EUKA|nr:hypothetical protein BLNAU_18572 [Blattamonas nauphoetae]
MESIMVLISSPSQAIAAAAMELLKHLILRCSAEARLALVKADLIPQLVLSLNPLSLSFTEGVDIHTNLMKTIAESLWLSTPYCLRKLGIDDNDEQQAGHEMVFQQVLVPSEKYISHLCVNRISIIDGEQSVRFLTLLAQILRISPYHQATMEIVLNMPVVLTIPSCLSFFDFDRSIWSFLVFMIIAQREWNKKGGEVREMGKKVYRMLRMEGIEDVIEGKLQTDKNSWYRGLTVDESIDLNNLQGMNLS